MFAVIIVVIRVRIVINIVGIGLYMLVPLRYFFFLLSLLIQQLMLLLIIISTVYVADVTVDVAAYSYLFISQYGADANFFIYFLSAICCCCSKNMAYCCFIIGRRVVVVIIHVVGIASFKIVPVL